MNRGRIMQYVRGSFGRGYIVEKNSQLDIYVPAGGEERTALWCYDHVAIGVRVRTHKLKWWMRMRLIFGGVIYRRGKNAGL